MKTATLAILLLFALGCADQETPTTPDPEPDCRCGTVQNVLTIYDTSTGQTEYEYTLKNNCSGNEGKYTQHNGTPKTIDDELCIGRTW